MVFKELEKKLGAILGSSCIVLSEDHKVLIARLYDTLDLLYLAVVQMDEEEIDDFLLQLNDFIERRGQ